MRAGSSGTSDLARNHSRSPSFTRTRPFASPCSRPALVSTIEATRRPDLPIAGRDRDPRTHVPYARRHRDDPRLVSSGRPPHRSQRALLTHWAPTSGSDVKALVRPRMHDADGWNPAPCDAVHPRPVSTAIRHSPGPFGMYRATSWPFFRARVDARQLPHTDPIPTSDRKFSPVRRRLTRSPRNLWFNVNNRPALAFGGSSMPAARESTRMPHK